jgi:hypothetical protein
MGGATCLIAIGVIAAAVFFLKGFDRIAGRGPKQVTDGINRSNIGQGQREGRAPCPHCAEWIMPAAKICPFCKSELQVTPPAP